MATIMIHPGASMKVFNRIKNLQKFLESARLKKKTIGLVPTMGSLHEGHQSLINKCAKENDIVVCSVFVNPIQFNNKTDLKKYPRNLPEDLQLLKDWNCTAVFVPSEKEMYPNGEPNISINFGYVEDILEGEFRPGHFAGVGIVVSKLFNIVYPDTAYFGLKDIQQCFVIKRLVKEMSYPVKLRFVKTKRERSGLAISSRNKRLTSEQKSISSIIYKALRAAKNALLKSDNIKRGIAAAHKILEGNKEIKLDYLEVIDLDSFVIIHDVGARKKIAICVAVFVSDVRLIDNVIIRRR